MYFTLKYNKNLMLQIHNRIQNFISACFNRERRIESGQEISADDIW